MSSSDQVQVQVQANGHAAQENSASSHLTSNTTSTEPALAVLGQLNEQRRIFLKSTIQEFNEEESREDVGTDTTDAEPQLRRQTPPPKTLTLSVKYATLPSPTVAQSQSALRSPLSPPPKPPMLSRTRSTGSGDARTPLPNGHERYSVTEQAAPAEVAAVEAATATATTEAATTTTPTSNHDEQPLSSTPPTPATVSARHYESLIEELRCPGCAGPLKAPVLLCKSGHSVCEQCTRILLMCPLCKVCNTLPPTCSPVLVR